MLTTKERERKIRHLIESVIKNHCRIYGTTLEIIEEGMLVYQNDEPLYYIGLEFNDSNFEIHFNGFVFFNLNMSKLIKLREIYREDELVEFLENNSMKLWFFEDEHLLTKQIIVKEYKDYSILKTAFAIELYEQINNTVAFRNHLAGLIEERETVVVN